MAILAYKDDGDRALGLAGMAMALYINDAEGALVALDLDSERGQGVVLGPEFHFAANPRYSAKLAWQQTLAEFKTLTAMAVGNAMCRRYVGQGTGLTQAEIQYLIDFASQQGGEMCALEPDECRRAYVDIMQAMHRVFSYGAARSVASQLSNALLEHRRLSGAECLDIMRTLQ